MSGPKSSSYSLDKRAKERMEQERREQERRWREEQERARKRREEQWERQREEQRRRREEQRRREEEQRRREEEQRRRRAEAERQREEARQNAIEKASQQYNECINELNNFQQVLKHHLEEELNDPEIVDSAQVIRNIKAEFLNKIEKLVALPLPLEAAEILILIEKIKRDYAQAKEQYDSQIAVEEVNLIQSARSRERLQKQMELKEQLKWIAKEEVNSFENITFTEVQPGNFNSVLEEAKDCLDQAGELINSLPRTERKQLEKLCEHINNSIIADLSPGEKSASLETHIRTFDLEKQRLSFIIQDYLAYSAACAVAGLEPREVSRFESGKQLAAETKRMRELGLQRREQEYVQEQIKEVMQALNYDVIRSDILQPAANGIRELYSLGAETAISTFISDTGTVMMEVVAIGDETPLTEYEIIQMLRNQDAFCDLYPKLVEELKKRGVILAKKVYQPPHRDFVRKITIRKGRKRDERGQAGGLKKLQKGE